MGLIWNEPSFWRGELMILLWEIDEALLPGAHQIIKVRHYHAFLMNGKDTFRHILTFLKNNK